MRFEHPKFENYWFGVEYNVFSRFEDELDDYVKNVKASIVRIHHENDPITSETVGTFELRIIELVRANADGFAIWDVCDSIDGYLAGVCEVFCDIECNQIRFELSVNPADILTIEELNINPEFRGIGLSLYAVMDAMRMFRRPNGICVMAPYSSEALREQVQCELDEPKAEQRAKSDLVRLKLSNYFSAIGFKPWGEKSRFIYRPLRNRITLSKNRGKKAGLVTERAVEPKRQLRLVREI